MPIKFKDIDAKVPKLDKKRLAVMLSDFIKEEGFDTGDIFFNFCSDDYLLKINLQYLNHNTYTDIITFDYSSSNYITGEIFISIERVIENANKFQTGIYSELSRVLIHGIMHLCGHNDSTTGEKLKMKSKEDYYLSKLASIVSRETE